jgi:hypothetical protein
MGYLHRKLISSRSMIFVLEWVKKQGMEMNNMNYKIQALNGFNMYFEQIISVFKTKYSEIEDISLDEISICTGLNRRKTRLILNSLNDEGIKLNKTKRITKQNLIEFCYKKLNLSYKEIQSSFAEIKECLI